MDVEEIKQKKLELNDKMAGLLNEFEDETGVQISDVGFVRRVSYDELGREVERVYRGNKSGIMNKKSQIYEFNPQVYPFRLWVCINPSLEDLQDKYYALTDNMERTDFTPDTLE